jgi:hypothetical protein
MKKLFNAQFGSMLNLTKSAFAIVLMFVVVGSVSAQRLNLSDLSPATDEEIESSLAAAPDCVPANTSTDCKFFAGLTTEIDAPAPYEKCKLEITYDLSICKGVFSVYNPKIDFGSTAECGELVKALDDLASTPIKQNLLYRQLYRKIGEVVSDDLANQSVNIAQDPFVYECDSKKQVITVNYYLGNCVSNWTGFKEAGKKKTFITRQVLCNKTACCITTSTYCTKDGILQVPNVTTKSEGNGITCDAATPADPPILVGVTWVDKSPCFSSCGSK